MAPALSQPLLLFCQAILLGMAAALLYDLLRAFRLRLPRLTSALDILYCMAAGLAVFLFMLRRAQGQLRLYLLLGAVGGGVLFFTAFSPFLRPVWDFWVDTLAFLLHLTAIPLRGAENLCKKIGRWGKNLFYSQMLYNKKHQARQKALQRRRAAWQEQDGSQRSGPEEASSPSF